MSRLRQPLPKAAIVVALATCALVASGAHAPRAQAASPCWKVLLNDWYDGRIDHVYPVHCYREAIKHLPSDVSTYSSAHDDILRALQSAIAKQRKAHKTVSANTPIPPESKGPNSGSGGGGSDNSGGGEPGRTTGGGLAGEVSSSSPSSVPTPLIVLAALALVLVAAGGAGLLAKRIQARRQGP